MAALIGVGEDADVAGRKAGSAAAQVELEQMEEDLDGLPIFDNRPIDFSGGTGLDGIPMVSSLHLCVMCVRDELP